MHQISRKTVVLGTSAVLAVVLLAGCAGTGEDRARAEAEKREAERQELEDAKRDQLDRLDEQMKD